MRSGPIEASITSSINSCRYAGQFLLVRNTTNIVLNINDLCTTQGMDLEHARVHFLHPTSNMKTPYVQQVQQYGLPGN